MIFGSKWLERFSHDCRNWDWFWFWFSFWFYYALWLASVFTLVLVLRQSSENRSIERFSLDCRKTKTKVNTLANQRA